MNKVKIFTKIGFMKDSKWLKGVILEEYENILVVETHGNKISIDKKLVKPIKHMKYDDQNGKYPELENFVENNWEQIKKYIKESSEHFFPDVKIKYDNENKIIECESLGLLISGALKEVETISCFAEIPSWEITLFKSIPATRYEPEDVGEILISSEPSNMLAAKKFIDNIWNINSEIYWDKFSCH